MVVSGHPVSPILWSIAVSETETVYCGTIPIRWLREIDT